MGTFPHLSGGYKTFFMLISVEHGILNAPGLEIYTPPLVFKSSLSVRTSENCYWLALSDE